MTLPVKLYFDFRFKITDHNNVFSMTNFFFHIEINKGKIVFVKVKLNDFAFPFIKIDPFETSQFFNHGRHRTHRLS